MKKWILPVIAVIIAVISFLVITEFLAGKKTGQVSGNYPGRNAEGDIVITSEKLSNDKVSFIKISEDSKIELLARLGDDGKVKIALGTCQSCSGSPNAYYTQEEDHLVCNNCGLTFPISVLDEPGGGCHPIMLPDTILERTGEGVVLKTDSLLKYEYLFEKVAEH